MEQQVTKYSLSSTSLQLRCPFAFVGRPIQARCQHGLPRRDPTPHVRPLYVMREGGPIGPILGTVEYIASIVVVFKARCQCDMSSCTSYTMYSVGGRRCSCLLTESITQKLIDLLSKALLTFKKPDSKTCKLSLLFLFHLTVVPCSQVNRTLWISQKDGNSTNGIERLSTYRFPLHIKACAPTQCVPEKE